jgi:hypothetical protein
MKKISSRPRIRVYLFIALLGLGLLVVCSTIIYRTANPADSLVIYYGRVISQRQLNTEVKNTFCGFFLLPEPIRLVRQLSGQPIAQCFDSLYEVNEWLSSIGHPQDRSLDTQTSPTKSI